VTVAKFSVQGFFVYQKVNKNLDLMMSSMNPNLPQKQNVVCFSCAVGYVLSLIFQSSVGGSNDARENLPNDAPLWIQVVLVATAFFAI